MLRARTLLLSPDGPRLERLLLTDAAFCVLGSRRDGIGAKGQIVAFTPDLLILDSFLPGQDALSFLRQLGRNMAAPPRILYLQRMNCETQTEIEADEVLPWPASDDQFLSAAHAALVPLPRLAVPYEALRLCLAEALLRDLGMPPALKGKTYLAHAAAMGACSPLLLTSLRDHCYPLLARQGNTTPAAVERAMRTAIESTWLRGNLDAIQRLFGFSVDADRGKPTNAECIAMLAMHVRQMLQNQMPEAGTP